MKIKGSLYSDAYDFPLTRRTRRISVMIAATPRSGSTHLTLDLWRTGRFGAPLEYLNIARQKDMVVRLGKGCWATYWDQLRTVRTSPNGVFSFKLFVSDLRELARISSPVLNQVSADYTVYLERKDKLSQAISFARALQTDQWYSIVKPKNAAKYSRQYIEQLKQQVIENNDTWLDLFDSTSTSFCTVYYEEYLDNPAWQMDRIFEFCNISRDTEHELDIPRLAIQRDSLSREWHNKYQRGD